MPVHVCKYLPILTTTYRRVVLKNENKNEKPFSHQGLATLSKRKWETSYSKLYLEAARQVSTA